MDFYADEVQELIRSEIPVVTIDHVFDGNIAVVSNNTQGMEDLVSYVYEQGHRRIAYIHGDNTSVTRMRLSGFYRTLQRLGVEIPDDYIKECPYMRCGYRCNGDRGAVRSSVAADLHSLSG